MPTIILPAHTQGLSVAWCYWTCSRTEQRWAKRKK